MVHQHFKLVSNYTIAENIIMGMEPVKRVLGLFPAVDIKKANEDIRKLSEEYGLEVDPTQVIEKVNVSIRQRVEILKMLYREAEILIFDEPTAVLTPQEIEFLLQIIRNLRDSGKTIILITHKLEEIKQVADRCAILNRGKIVDVLDVKTTSTKKMANLMVGREVSFTVDKSPRSSERLCWMCRMSQYTTRIILRLLRMCPSRYTGARSSLLQAYPGTVRWSWRTRLPV